MGVSDGGESEGRRRQHTAVKGLDSGGGDGVSEGREDGLGARRMEWTMDPSSRTTGPVRRPPTNNQRGEWTTTPLRVQVERHRASACHGNTHNMAGRVRDVLVCRCAAAHRSLIAAVPVTPPAGLATHITTHTRALHTRTHRQTNTLTVGSFALLLSAGRAVIGWRTVPAGRPSHLSPLTIVCLFLPLLLFFLLPPLQSICAAMSAPGRSASTAALALSAGAGAAAATSLLLAWSWWQQGRDAQRQRQHADSAHERSCPAVHGANSQSQSQSLVAPAHGPGGRCRAGSLSQSRARLDTHESSRVSECSYLEDREYEHYEQLAEEDEDMDDEGEAEEPALFMCPHCSNYINASELIVPGPMVDHDGNPLDDEDGEAAGIERAQSVQAARILSAAEQLSIQQALRESLQQIFVSVDEDGDGLITRDEMGAFLKKLGLTGEREAAFLNIIGGDSVQPFALTSAAPTPDSKSAAAGAAPLPSGDKRGSHSSQRGSGIGASSGGGGGGSHNGSLSGPRAGSGAGGGVRVGINFRQFFERFQDTLEGMDALNPDASDDEATIPTNPVHLDPAAAFSSASPDASPALAPAAAKSAPPFPEASLLFTPPRPASSSVTSASSSSRLTVNTATPSGGSSGSSSGASLLQPPPSASSSSSALNSPLFSPSTAAAVAAAASPSIRVFLGGACGDTTWRADVAIPQLTAAGVSFYDPQVKDWSPKLVALEGLMKAWCKILLFVIGKQTRALASMIEVAALIAAGRKVVLVVEPIEPGVEIEGQVPSSRSEHRQAHAPTAAVAAIAAAA